MTVVLMPLSPLRHGMFPNAELQVGHYSIVVLALEVGSSKRGVQQGIQRVQIHGAGLTSKNQNINMQANHRDRPLVKCPRCSSSSLRRSRLRLIDILRLFILRYPLRCLKCHRRSYIGVSTLLAARRLL